MSESVCVPCTGIRSPKGATTPSNKDKHRAGRSFGDDDGYGYDSGPLYDEKDGGRGDDSGPRWVNAWSSHALDGQHQYTGYDSCCVAACFCSSYAWLGQHITSMRTERNEEI